MKKIVILKGNPNTGKSTTLKKVLTDIFKVKIYRPAVKVDVVVSFKYKNKTIVIMTIGDIVPIIEDYLAEINEEFDL